jgi:hypothetical protein
VVNFVTRCVGHHNNIIHWNSTQRRLNWLWNILNTSSISLPPCDQ